MPGVQWLKCCINWSIQAIMKATIRYSRREAFQLIKMGRSMDVSVVEIYVVALALQASMVVLAVLEVA